MIYEVHVKGFTQRHPGIQTAEVGIAGRQRQELKGA